MTMTVKRPLALLVCAAALVAACGDDDDEATTAGTTEESEASTQGSAEAPERIVSLSASATEMLFAIGAGDRVVAVDDQSDFPEDVPTTDLSGYEPNVEAVATYEPDLVVTSGIAEDVIAGLEALDIEVLVLDAPVVLDEAYDQISALGTATGHPEEADDLIEEMRSDIAELVASVPDHDEAPTYYHELDDTLYTITSDTFIGEIYGLAGLVNVADPADPDGALGGYPQLSSEFLVAADPDYVFLADTECCGQSAETLAARPGFADLSAIRDGHVVELDDDIASRWGPRVVDFLRTIIEATASAPA
jgi:iron complex transport system substrate-binding protein